MDDWLGIARLPGALRRAGFEVAALCSPNIQLAHTRELDRRYFFGASPSRSLVQRARKAAEIVAPGMTRRLRRALGPALDRVVVPERGGEHMLAFLTDAIRDWRPRFVVFGDEATRRLGCAAVLAANFGQPRMPEDALEVVRASVGNPEYFEQTNRKSSLMDFCHREGYLAPPNQVVTRPEQIDDFARRHGYPVMLKFDFEAGGWGVEQSSSPEQTREVLALLTDRVESARRPVTSPGDSVVSVDAKAELSVQKRIEGTGWNSCMVAIEGNVLASFTFRKCQTIKANAPSSVVHYAPNREIDGLSRRLVSHLGFTGFCESEFIVDATTGRPYLIEFNPRPAPSCHHGEHFGADLSRALRAGLGGPPYHAEMPDDLDWTVARFPQEWLRDADSEWLSSAYHDVPWDDPNLIEHLCGGAEAARRFRERYHPPASGRPTGIEQDSAARAAG